MYQAHIALPGSTVMLVPLFNCDSYSDTLYDAACRAEPNMPVHVTHQHDGLNNEVCTIIRHP